MSKLNRKIVAKNFVTSQDAITRGLIGVGLAHNPIEKATRNSLVETRVSLNVLRLLVLTNNLTDEEFAAQSQPLNQEIEKLSKLIWPK